jgi:hypothetical protein
MREKREGERERTASSTARDKPPHRTCTRTHSHTPLLLLAVREFKLSAAHSTSRTGGEGPCCCETYRMAPLKVPFAGR